MAKNSFLMLNLKDKKSSEIAKIMSNETSKKILDFLAEHEATESQISSRLGLPISTVHYNLEQLIKSGLVVAERFHYSEKGKEVKHYKIANKFILISPSPSAKIPAALKKMFPIALILILISLSTLFVPFGSIFTDKSTSLSESIPLYIESRDAADYDFVAGAQPEYEDLEAQEIIQEDEGKQINRIIFQLTLLLAFIIIIVSLIYDLIYSKR